MTWIEIVFLSAGVISLGWSTVDDIRVFFGKPRTAPLPVVILSLLASLGAAGFLFWKMVL